MTRNPGMPIWAIAFIGTWLAVLGLVDPVPQDPAYHAFADRRTLLGLPNAADVLSNLGFLAAGLWGWHACSRGHFRHPSERRAWRLLFAAVIATTFGSAWYHLAPDTPRLVWDRLPMAVAFMALLAALVSERLDARLGARLLWPLAGLGVASVGWWAWTESTGGGDLRAYALVQFLTLLAAAGLLLRQRAPYSHAIGYWLALAGYALAKLTEYADRGVFTVSGEWFSGHSAKHLLAAAGVAALAWMLTRRRPR